MIEGCQCGFRRKAASASIFVLLDRPSSNTICLMTRIRLNPWDGGIVVHVEVYCATYVCAISRNSVVQPCYIVCTAYGFCLDLSEYGLRISALSRLIPCACVWSPCLESWDRAQSFCSSTWTYCFLSYFRSLSFGSTGSPLP